MPYTIWQSASICTSPHHRQKNLKTHLTTAQIFFEVDLYKHGYIAGRQSSVVYRLCCKGPIVPPALRPCLHVLSPAMICRSLLKSGLLKGCVRHICILQNRLLGTASKKSLEASGGKRKLRQLDGMHSWFKESMTSNKHVEGGEGRRVSGERSQCWPEASLPCHINQEQLS